MEDLAHFIQSMSEKYGLLDGSQKHQQQHQQQRGENHHQGQQLLLQDHTSSAASNTFNGSTTFNNGSTEECQASSWECLSIFISNSQSIDCKAVPAGPHGLPALANHTRNSNSLSAPPKFLHGQQRLQQNHVRSSPPHSFSKLIDIDEHESPPHHNTSASMITQQLQEQDSPENDSSHCHPGASSAAQINDVLDERGMTIFDSCGDLSTAVSMSDYVQQHGYFPEDGPHPAEQNSCPSVSKSSEQAKIVQYTKKRSGTSTSRGDSKALLQLQSIQNTTKGKEGGVPFKDSEEELLHSIMAGKLEQEDKSTPLSGELQAQQRARNSRRRRGVSSTSVGLDSEAEFGDFDIALHEFDISSGRTSRDTHTGTPDTDGTGCHSQEAYQIDHDHLGEGGILDNNLEKNLSLGGSTSTSNSSRARRYHAAASDASLKSFEMDHGSSRLSSESHGELQEREMRGSGGHEGARNSSSCTTSNEASPPGPENHHHHEQQQQQKGTTAYGHGVSSNSCPDIMTSLDYLPISSAIESRVAELDEASKELFAAAQTNDSQNLNNQLNKLSLGLFGDDQQFGHNNSSGPGSGSENAVLKKKKKGRSFRENFSYVAAAAAADHEEEQQPERESSGKLKMPMKKPTTAAPFNPKNPAESKRPAVSFQKSSGCRNVAADNSYNSDDAKFLETSWEFEREEEQQQPEREPSGKLKASMKKPTTAAPSCNTKNPAESKRPAVSFQKSSSNRNVASDSYHSDDAKFLETSWDFERDEGLFTGEMGRMREGVREVNVEGGSEPKWSHINKLLCEHGFSPLDWQVITSANETADKFFHTIHDVVRNYGRREAVLQELLAEREELRQEEKHSIEMMQKLEAETDTVKRKLATSEQRAELANAAAEKTYAVLRKEHQRLEASHASMLQRCSQLEHVSRSKERAVRKLQEKIQEAVQREERQRSKEKELYEKLKHKTAVGQKAQGEVVESNFLLRDLKPATIVGIYERQRAAAEAERNNLREENSRLRQELRDKENSLLSKMQAISNEEIARSGLNKREHVLFQQLAEAVNQKEDLKKDIANLKGQLKLLTPEEQNSSPALLQRLQIDDAQNSKSNQSVQDISQRKKESNSCSALQVGNVNGCTALKCQEFLKGICSRLKIADPVYITGAIDGLLKVVAAVPRMETFIEQVCDIVFNDGSTLLARENPSNVLQTPEAVPGILKSWLEQLLSLEELRQFKESVARQLWERFGGKAANNPISSRVAAATVKDLIDIEREYLLSQASYREGEITLRAEPQKLLHRIISHFQMLFEIPSLEGVMAVMNNVYIQVSEYHNFARALCSMLGLPKDAGPNSIVSTITSVLNKG